MVLLLMLKILYDLETLEDQNSKKIKYLWSCRISSINRRTILGLGVQYLRLKPGMSLGTCCVEFLGIAMRQLCILSQFLLSNTLHSLHSTAPSDGLHAQALEGLKLLGPKHAV